MRLSMQYFLPRQQADDFSLLIFSYDHDGCFVFCRLCRKFADLASDLEGKLCCDIVPWIPASCHAVSDLRVLAS